MLATVKLKNSLSQEHCGVCCVLAKVRKMIFSTTIILCLVSPFIKKAGFTQYAFAVLAIKMIQWLYVF